MVQAAFTRPMWLNASAGRVGRQVSASVVTTERSVMSDAIRLCSAALECPDAGEPAPSSREAAALIASLGDQRHHVLGILEGLDEESLRRPVLPSGWTCLGMVRHLTREVERFWFRGVVAGEPDVRAELAGRAPDVWTVPARVTAEEVFASYREEIERADAILAAGDLDAAPAYWPEELFGDWRLADVRKVALHVIAETACHAGHLDVVRELIDGRAWRVADE
jgi:hypothetical protein